MRHGDHEPAASPGSLALEQSCEDLRHGAERSCGEVRDLERWQPRCRVLEDAGPAEVVDVVPGSQAMPMVVAETGDRAVDGRLRDVVGADAEPFGDTGAKALEDDVGPRTERLRECGFGGKVADDGLAPGAKRGVPCRRRRPHRIAARRLDSHDTSSEACELAARVRARQVAREVDDERSRERLHGGGAYLYPRRR